MEEPFDLVTGTVIISIVENRSREICIAKMNSKCTGSLEVFLLCDNHSYVELMSLIEDCAPHEILIHDGQRNSIMSTKVQRCFSHSSSIVFISRQYFDQDRGAELLSHILVGKTDQDLIAKYTVLAGTHCLLRYCENCSGYTFPAHSVRLEYMNSNPGKMMIDRRSAINLELICNTRTGSQRESLFGIINHTKTNVGAAMLRKAIMSPCADRFTIEMRLDVVELFLRNNRIYAECASIISKFPDFEKLISGLVLVPKLATNKTARIGIDTLIYLKHSLRLAPQLAANLDILSQQSASSHSPRNGHQEQNGIRPNQLIASIVSNLRDENFESILQRIDELLTESTTFSKSAFEMRHQECFAVRSNIDGYLDVARKTFLQDVEDIHSAAETYSLMLGQQVKVLHNNTRGYYLSIPVNKANASDQVLPAEFLQPVLNKRSISCTTEEILSLSDRANESIALALTLTNNIIQELKAQVRLFMDRIFLFVDSIALVDMLISFADCVALDSQTYVRPTIIDSGSLVLRGGRHPMMSSLQCKAGGTTHDAFIANDCFLSSKVSFVVITGPNGSGKSTFIKQVALLVIMAQIGSFVPAIHAVIPVYTRILTRIGAGDDLEHNISTFSMEMKEMAYILEHASEKSLTIIDELGRGTSNIDGIVLAFSISEELIRLKTPCLFVTHYSQITSLPTLYPSATNIHLKTALGVLSEGLTYLHSVAQGACEIKSGYGIMMAKVCNFPDHMISEARAIKRIVTSSNPILLLDNLCRKRNIDLETIMEKVLVLNESSLSPNGMREYLHDLCRSYEGSREDILRRLDTLELQGCSLIEFHGLKASPVGLPQAMPLARKILSTNIPATAAPVPLSHPSALINSSVTTESNSVLFEDCKMSMTSTQNPVSEMEMFHTPAALFKSGRLNADGKDDVDFTEISSSRLHRNDSVNDQDDLFDDMRDLFGDFVDESSIQKDICENTIDENLDLDINSFDMHPNDVIVFGFSDQSSRSDIFQFNDRSSYISPSDFSLSDSKKRFRSVD